MNWKTIDRPGYIGKQRAERQAIWNERYGPENWRIAYAWGNAIINREIALQLYEDAYYEFFKANSEKLAWITANASDVFDTAPTNVSAGLDYTHQETPDNHIQDIAIRRSVLRLGKTFRGGRLIQVRSSRSEGYELNPGLIPFHLPEMILNPRMAGWWSHDSIEDFYQSNKVFQIKE